MDGQSFNIRTEKLRQLKVLFPEVFTENKINLSRIKQVLGDDIFAEAEHYELSWAGKNEARQETEKQTSATLINRGNLGPLKNAPNQMPHILIEGENLEVLRVLQKSYFGKVKVIYIDPPYNTGNDSFIYPDNYNERQKTYQKRTGITDNQGFLNKQDLWQKNSKENGQFHSIWLSMMYPRLYLARNLMREDGVIFISIDDHEASNLKLLCDEIFGQENFIANFIIVRSEGGGIAKQAVIGHDYLLAYAKNITEFKPLRKAKDIRGKIVLIEDQEYWIEEDWLRKEFSKYGTCSYQEIAHYHGVEKKQEIDDGIKNGIYRIIDKNGVKIVGRLRKISEDGSKFYTILKHLNKNGVVDLEQLGISDYFSYPKPLSLIKFLVSGATFSSKDQNEIILDFFAGSGTTAQAVLELNEEDGGNRRFMCVQIPELLEIKSAAYQGGYRSIFDLSKTRINKAIDLLIAREKMNQHELQLMEKQSRKIEKKLGKNSQQSQGIKKIVDELEKIRDILEKLRHKAEIYAGLNNRCQVYQLGESNFQTWRSNLEGKTAILEQLELFQISEKHDSMAENIVTELILKSGLELGITYQKIAGFYQLDKIWVCLEKFTKEMKNAIITGKPEKVICLNSCFIDDDILTNLQLELTENSIELLIV